jgi:ubiquinone/menaquinone biosynthesis C-methylase UbiE
VTSDEKRIATSRTWFKKDTADYWRHSRMYEAVDCFKVEPESKWLTVGDGRFGLDSIRISEKGFASVTPSDISEALLKRSKEEGRIQHYRVENAESLSFESDEFDYVFCKESYHHFPQPLNALYEMLRLPGGGDPGRAQRCVIHLLPGHMTHRRHSREASGRKLRIGNYIIRCQSANAEDCPEVSSESPRV